MVLPYVRWMTRLSFVAIFAIIGLLTFTAGQENARQQSARQLLRGQSITRGTDLYAYNCAECHGSAGQGDIQPDATRLSDDYMRSQDEDWLFKSISRGRDDTEMAPFHLDEGGAFNHQQVNDLVALIKYGSWDVITARVVQLDRVSPEEMALAAAVETVTSEPDELPLIAVQQPANTDTGTLPLIAVQPTANADTLPLIAVLPSQTPESDTNQKLAGMTVYATHCAACHGEQGEGTNETTILRQERLKQLSADELIRISFANPGINGHNAELTQQEIDSLVYLMQTGALPH